MSLVATRRVSRGASRAGTVSVPLRRPLTCSVTTTVTTGTLVVLTDLAMTSGYPGRPESADALLRSAEAWMGSSGLDLPCLAMQLGFDVAGRPQLILAVRGGSTRDGGHPRGIAAPSIAVDARECTICTFTENAAEEPDLLGDAEVALLAEARSWMNRHKDFAITGSWLAHDSAGHASFILIGDGATAVRPIRKRNPGLAQVVRS